MAALLRTILPNHETGLIKVLPYSFHRLVDRIVGIVFAVAPFIFGFQGVDAAFYWINAAAALAVTLRFKAPERARRGVHSRQVRGLPADACNFDRKLRRGAAVFCGHL